MTLGSPSGVTNQQHNDWTGDQSQARNPFACPVISVSFPHSSWCPAGSRVLWTPARKGAPELGPGASRRVGNGEQHETGGHRPRAGLGLTSSWLPVTTQLEVWIITQRMKCAHVARDPRCVERCRGRGSDAGGVVQLCTDQGSHICHQEACTLEVLVSGSNDCLYRVPGRRGASREP